MQISTREIAEKTVFKYLLIEVLQSFNWRESKLADGSIWEFKTLCCYSVFTIHLNFLWIR